MFKTTTNIPIQYLDMFVYSFKSLFNINKDVYINLIYCNLYTLDYNNIGLGHMYHISHMGNVRQMQSNAPYGVADNSIKNQCSPWASCTPLVFSHTYTPSHMHTHHPPPPEPPAPQVLFRRWLASAASRSYNHHHKLYYYTIYVYYIRE